MAHHDVENPPNIFFFMNATARHNPTHKCKGSIYNLKRYVFPK